MKFSHSSEPLCLCISSTSSSGCYSEDFSKAEEQKLREYIHQLKAERASIKSTVMELESLHMDAPIHDPPRQNEACRLDLENAVLMQELMAMKVSLNNAMFRDILLVNWKEK